MKALTLVDKKKFEIIEKDIPKTINTCFNIENVWKFGISGDNPIILLEIKNIEELYVLEELLNTIEFFNVKKIKIDLCILNNEKMSYETFVKDEINEVIKNHRLEYLRDNQIFVLNKNIIYSCSYKTYNKSYGSRNQES